jgi:hypothetical protein
MSSIFIHFFSPAFDPMKNVYAIKVFAGKKRTRIQKFFEGETKIYMLGVGPGLENRI